MEYTAFEIRNFKGIEHLKLELGTGASGSIFTLVGLNESGKTTVLEAIGYFDKKEKHLESLYEEEFRYGDVHDLIPMKRKANFNDSISVSATLLLSGQEKSEIADFAKRAVQYRMDPTSISDSVTITSELHFSDSTYHTTKNLWEISLPGKPLRGRKDRDLLHYDKKKWLEVVGFLRNRLPSILYFPTFLFEFPSRIYLELTEDESPTNAYYREIVQDVLDSLDDDLEIQQHIVKRALRGGYNNKRNLDSVLNKMGNVVTKTVFERWNEVFDRKIPKKDIVVTCDVEETTAGETSAQKVYLQFMIKDGDSVYLITERSLGFRWFFCFLLFTQFRQHRKTQTDTLFLFDEPASNLHSKAQTQLIRSFAKITETTGKIVYSTHSHYMINPRWLENAYIVRNEGLTYDDGDRDYDYSSQDTDVKVERYRHFVGQNPEKVTFFQPILDTLDYVPSNLEYIPQATFLEGKNDYYLIEYFRSISDGTSSSFGFIPGIGASGLDTVLALYLGWGRQFLVLLDDDKEGRKNKNRYQREWMLADDQVFTLADVDKSWSGSSTQHLIEDEDIERLRSEFYPSSTRKLTKKQIVKAIQELLMREESRIFSPNTVSRFLHIVDFCAAKLGFVPILVETAQAPIVTLAREVSRESRLG